MGILEDTVKVLERIPIWKRLTTLPDEVARLEQRVKQLEDVLRTASGDKCPKCRSMTFSLQESKPAPDPWGEMGVREDHFRCSNCGYTDVRQRSP